MFDNQSCPESSEAVKIKPTL